MGDIISLTYHVNVPPELFRGVLAHTQQAVDDALRAVLEDGQRFVRGRFSLIPPSAPGNPPAIDTGNLYRHIEIGLHAGGAGGYLRAATEYAIYLELGTSRMAARPFMLPAALYMQKQLPRIIRQQLQGRRL